MLHAQIPLMQVEPNPSKALDRVYLLKASTEKVTFLSIVVYKCTGLLTKCSGLCKYQEKSREVWVESTLFQRLLFAHFVHHLCISYKILTSAIEAEKLWKSRLLQVSLLAVQCFIALKVSYSVFAVAFCYECFLSTGL